jgi:hypothetical protein
MNESQLKFFDKTQSISQTQPDAPLFKLGQDNIAIDELLVLKTGLEITAKIRIDASKNTCKTMTIKIRQKNNLNSHRHFIEHLVYVFKKPPCEND